LPLPDVGPVPRMDVLKKKKYLVKKKADVSVHLHARAVLHRGAVRRPDRRGGRETRCVRGAAGETTESSEQGRGVVVHSAGSGEHRQWPLQRLRQSRGEDVPAGEVPWGADGPRGVARGRAERDDPPTARQSPAVCWAQLFAVWLLGLYNDRNSAVGGFTRTSLGPEGTEGKRRDINLFKAMWVFFGYPIFFCRSVEDIWLLYGAKW